MPAKALLPHQQIPLLDEDGNQIYIGGELQFEDTEEFEFLWADFEFFTEMDDVCLQEVFSRANGDINISYCIGKEKIIINKNVTTRKR
jgi:hypothetical protein